MSAIRIIISAIMAIFCSTAAMGQQRPAASAPQPEPIARANFIQTMDGEFKKMDADKNGS